MHYRVQVGVHPLARTHPRVFRALVEPLIQHPRGWASHGHVFHLNGTNTHHPLITITLAPQVALDVMFPDFSQERLSLCDMDTREIFLNEQRWYREYDDDKSGLSLPAYRLYMVQHEIGHALGLGHAKCGGPGENSPIMVQQTKGTGACKPYPFVSTPRD